MNKTENNFTNKLETSLNRKGLRNVFIFELVLAGSWIAVGEALSDGTLMAVFNILFLLISVALLFATYGFLKFWLSKFSSFILAVIVWLIIFGVLRGLF